MREQNPGNTLLESAYGRKGDRADPSTWPEVKGPLTVVLFEGWMLGFKPIPNEVVKAVDPQLSRLRSQAASTNGDSIVNISSWVTLRIEIAMREEGKPERPMRRLGTLFHATSKAYKAYLPKNVLEGPLGYDPSIS
ncbi:hypothetical protein IFM89_024132 [Coptis chinensis]|uniref:Uncharacterized protein n=1 Tax=Coptis chinensis TaxID=261450 RepID=A0A835LFF6_9MAGN|nr:hypothetical protein IFM89_024132 [Coptis chinensis]